MSGHRHHRADPGDVVTGQWEYAEREKKIEQTANLDAERFGGDRSKFETWTEQEPGSSGKESADRTIRNSLRGFKAYKETATGDKVTRALPATAKMEGGLILFPKDGAKWWDAFQTELLGFPKAKHDDQVDCLAYAVKVARKIRKLRAPIETGYGGAGACTCRTSIRRQRSLPVVKHSTQNTKWYPENADNPYFARGRRAQYTG